MKAFAVFLFVITVLISLGSIGVNIIMQDMIRKEPDRQTRDHMRKSLSEGNLKACATIFVLFVAVLVVVGISLMYGGNHG